MTYSSKQWDEGLLALHKAGIPAIIDCNAQDYFYRLTGSDTLAQCRRIIESPREAKIIATRRQWGVKP
jgi:hypothetical protein